MVQIISVVGDRIVLRAERAPEPTPAGWTQSAQAGLIGRALIEDAPVLSEDVSREPSYRSTLQSRGIRSELVAPIRTAKGTWGVINLEDTAVAAFDRDDASLLAAYAAVLGTMLNAIDLYASLDGAYLGTAEALSAALESKDTYTAEHSRAIADNAIAVGAQLGLEGEELRMLRYAAALHDIGKIGIPREILNKPAPPRSRRAAQGPGAHADRRADHRSDRVPRPDPPGRPPRPRALGRKRLPGRPQRRRHPARRPDRLRLRRLRRDDDRPPLPERDARRGRPPRAPLRRRGAVRPGGGRGAAADHRSPQRRLIEARPVMDVRRWQIPTHHASKTTTGHRETLRTHRAAGPQGGGGVWSPDRPTPRDPTAPPSWRSSAQSWPGMNC